MRITKCEVSNFASYENLEIDFTNQGLTLISGPTGSGKSTLCDIIPWVLFGKTSKGGAVDDILSWPGDRVTTGCIELHTGLKITRTRSKKSKDNDLYFTQDGNQTRGKDITDTQRLINQHLGVDCQLYLSGAYVHEFSDTASFFITTPKNRRAICEQIVDLSLAKKIQAYGSEKRKIAKKALEAGTLEIAESYARLEMSKYAAVKVQKRSDDFEADKTKKVAALTNQYQEYKKDVLEAIKDLETRCINLEPHCNSSTCNACGAPSKAFRELQDNRKQLTALRATKNPYYTQLQAEKTRRNTYAQDLIEAERNAASADEKLKTAYSKQRTLAETSGDLELLSDIISAFRANLVLSTIRALETSTNSLLSKHFDGEIQVQFETTDDVDVLITKDGNACAYSQLSKGQRQLLKLCFAVSVMEQVSNHHGVHFPQVFFDEALDGLDADLKVKAFSLLQTIALKHESVFVVEHSDALKPLFSNTYRVSLRDGSSVIEGL